MALLSHNDCKLAFIHPGEVGRPQDRVPAVELQGFGQGSPHRFDGRTFQWFCIQALAHLNPIIERVDRGDER